MKSCAMDLASEGQTLLQLRAAGIAPRPKRVGETGLSLGFLSELLEKHLYDAGAVTLAVLGNRTALAGPILDEALSFLRKEGRIEVRGPTTDDFSLRYALTERGRSSAQDAIARSGYVGPAPVPLAVYAEVVRAQSVRDRVVTRERMHAAFTDVILDTAVLDQLGPALNSGKAIFIYGAAGTGKTYVTQRLSRLLDDSVLVPHAISVGETVIQLFDPSVHLPLGNAASGVMLDEGYDPRFVLCRRPLVFSGGELSAEMLEVHFEPATRGYRAPLQLKATNGMLIIDDLGRQRVAPQVVLNRWIVPMEQGIDYLTLPTGQHFAALLDVILVFSTNLRPDELADDAFLRRIGYKIHFEPVTPDRYHRIWAQVCAEHGVDYDPAVCQRVIDGLYQRSKMPLLACHPRDLIDMALDHAAYLRSGDELRPEALEWAWDTYFVRTNV
jgi:hypothetical protein